MTRGFALVAENPADVWVMDPAVESAEQTTNLPDSALARVRSVDGVRSAVPLALGTADARFPNGRFQPFQLIGIDDATLFGLPALERGTSPGILRAPDAVIVDAGGTTEKLETPVLTADQWRISSANRWNDSRSQSASFLSSARSLEACSPSGSSVVMKQHWKPKRSGCSPVRFTEP